MQNKFYESVDEILKHKGYLMPNRYLSNEVDSDVRKVHRCRIIIPLETMNDFRAQKEKISNNMEKDLDDMRKNLLDNAKKEIADYFLNSLRRSKFYYYSVSAGYYQPLKNIEQVFVDDDLNLTVRIKTSSGTILDVHQSGICTSNQHLVSFDEPFMPTHE